VSDYIKDKVSYKPPEDEHHEEFKYNDDVETNIDDKHGT
jgi:hypothetical protein